MSRVKVTTIRSVHIGNGNILRKNSDFIIDGNDIYIIDPKKVLDIIGLEKLDYWVSAIENREDIKQFIRRIGKNAFPIDYCIRQIHLYNNFEDDDEYKIIYKKKIREKNELKECIHDGFGNPYIPGSSIKGAIRTALMTSIIKKNNINEYNLLKDKNKDFLSLKKKDLTSKNVENEILGGIQNSLLKYLRVGDVIFNKGSEFVIHMINLNIRNKNDNLQDDSKEQIIEVISYDQEAECNITFDLDRYNFALQQNSKTKNISLPKEMESLSSIFKTVNQHTKKLIEEDIKFWEDISKDKDGAVDYINKLNDILEDIDACEDDKECILKLGHASGWRFTTGAWLEKYDWFNHKIVPILRDPKKYDGYPFPKTRRIESYPDVLGFIKLSIID